MQNVLILLRQCIICYNIVAVILMTSGSLWNYYRDEVNDYGNENDNANNRINNKKTRTSKYF